MEPLPEQQNPQEPTTPEPVATPSVEPPVMSDTPTQETPAAPFGLPPEIPSVAPTSTPAPEPTTPAPQPSAIRTIPLVDIPPPAPRPIASEPQPTPEPVIVAPPVAPQQSEPPHRPTIRTLQSDIAETVRGNQMSVATIAMAQQAKNQREGVVPEQKDRMKIVWIIGSTILVLAGAAALAFAFIYISNRGVVPLVIEEGETPLIRVDSQTVVDITDITRAEILSTLNGFVLGTTGSPIDIHALVLAEKASATSSAVRAVTISRFIDRIGTRAPGRLVRSLGPQMLFGAVGTTPFLMTPTSSYENAFAGLLEWEIFIAADLSFIAKQPPAPLVAPIETATTTATTTPGTTTTANQIPPAPPVFKDVVVKNKDARALVNADGEIILIYSFPKEDILVITQNKEALSVLIDAINAPTFGQ